MLLVQKAARSWPALLLGRVIEWMPRWARWSIAAVALMMPVAAFTYGHELKRAVKAAWSRWDVERARPLLGNEITAQEGVNLLLNALIRSPDEPAVIRSLAQLTDEAGMPVHSRFFYEHLARRNAMTTEDRLRHAAILARLHDHTGAQIVLQKIKQMEGETPDFLRTQAEISAGRGDLTSARVALAKVLVQVPKDEVAPLQHAKAQAFSAESGQRQAGIEQLLDLFEKSLNDYDDARRTHCFWTLASMPISDAMQRERFARLIERMPWKKLERRVMQRLLEASLDSTDHDGTRLRDWLREMFVREASTEAEERVAIAKMLQRRDLHYLVLEWISFDMGLQETALCTTRLDSLIAVKLWTEASAMIEHTDCPLPHAFKAIMRAHVELAATGGKTLKGGELLREALTAADKRDNQGAFVAIARLAAQFDQRDIALTAYGKALDPRFPVALFLADAFIEEARRGGGSAAIVLRHLTQRIHDEAWNQELLRQVRYYRVLCGDGIEVVEEEALQMLRQQPGEAYGAFLLTFARYRMGKSTDAKSYLPLLFQPHIWTAGERSALHAIFAATGDVAAAEVFKRSLPPGTALFVEERRLLSASN